MPFGKISRLNPPGAVKYVRAQFKNSRRYFPAKKTTRAKVNTIQKKVRELAPEIKYVQQVWSFVASNNSFGGANSILRQAFAVAKGNDVNQRQGAKLMGKALQFRYNLINTSANDSVCYYRICMIYDKRPNTANAMIDQIFDSFTLPGGFVVPISQLNVRNRTFQGRFVFMYDKCGVIGGTGSAAANDVTGGNIPALRSDFRSLRAKKPTMYTQGNNDGLIGGITDGNYILLVWTSIADGGANSQPLFTANLRFLYTDV